MIVAHLQLTSHTLNGAANLRASSMPEYFYHVGLELFDTADSSTTTISRAIHELNPFTSTQVRTSRNTKYDQQKHSMPSSAYKHTSSSSDDRRIDKIDIDSAEEENDISTGIGTKLASAQTRAAFQPLEEVSSGTQKGIIHLYRETDETPGLYLNRGDRISPSHLWDGSATARSRTPSKAQPPKDDECTIISILAVPSYMTPKDFLAFIGQDTTNSVSHVRMLRTSRLNRYMVLMKFRDGRVARQWQHDWNGKVFNSMEPETCHVVFVRSVHVFANETADEEPTDHLASRALVNKPRAPPTPALIELPTCPVCLERMDESTGLLTVLCQHVFHCSCLEKWSGGGCPVCRYAHDDFSVTRTRPNTKKKFDQVRGEFDIVDDGELECGVCHIHSALWQCLICGYVGCGRFQGKHAMDHYKRSDHAFAIDLESQRVWDYERDCYVHRIIANGSSTRDEKLVELPGRKDNQPTALFDNDQDIDLAKRENLAFEYTQLLTSQLESQRIYFEEVVARAADKATDATRKAEQASSSVVKVYDQQEKLTAEISDLRSTKLQFEKEISRLTQKTQKLEVQKNKFEAELLETIELLNTISTNSKIRETESTSKRNEMFKKQAANITELQNELATRNFYIESLQEQCRDMKMQLDARERLQGLVDSGQLTQEDLRGATIEARPAPSKSVVHRGGAINRPADILRNEPTEEEIDNSIKTATGLGVIAATVLNRLEPGYRWKAHVQEKDVLKRLLPLGQIKKNQKGFTLSSAFDQDVVLEILVKQDMLEKDSTTPMQQILQKAIQLAGIDYSLVDGKNELDIQQVLIDAGILQRKAEDGLYDSDDGPTSSHDVQKTKKKKRNKKKK